MVNIQILHNVLRLFAYLAKFSKEENGEQARFLEHYLSQRLSYQEIEAALKVYLEFYKKDVNIQAQELKSINKETSNTTSYGQRIVILTSLISFAYESTQKNHRLYDLIYTLGVQLQVDKEDLIQLIVLHQEDLSIDPKLKNLIVVHGYNRSEFEVQGIKIAGFKGLIKVIYIQKAKLFILRKIDESVVYLQNSFLEKDILSVLAPGAMLRFESGKQLFFSDFIHTLRKNTNEKIYLEAKNIISKIKNEKGELIAFDFRENQGKLIGIIGASGAGKSTFINMLSGAEKNGNTSITINGYDINDSEEDTIKGIIGYVGQDDILIENLTVYENLLYNAKLCFGNKTNELIERLVKKTLAILDLTHVADVEVGNVLRKKISGGQRKRLMIALELIREPQILFLDEPTSGLSSNDSKNVIRLLKEMAVRGKLVITVIHQPSLEVFHSFDRIMVLDQGGVPVFYGTTEDCIDYFKTAAVEQDMLNPLFKNNINPDLILETLEAKVFDDYGAETTQRRFAPEDWYKRYKEKILLPKTFRCTDKPRNNLFIPNEFRQWILFLKRDLHSKFNSKTYLLIMLLEAPALALGLSFILRHDNDYTNSNYVFAYNDNIPAYLLIAIIVSLFLGLTSSVQEIIKDQKILKREKFLNLSRNSYLFSKIVILFMFSAIQMLSFVAIANYVLGIKGMFFEYWLILFSISAAANLLGLCISDSLKSMVSAYILIPIILIPQLVLSGALFDFDKLNQSLSSYGKTPILADAMISRWGYEALAVTQDKMNRYNQVFYPIDYQQSMINYRKNYWLPELIKWQDNLEYSSMIDNELYLFQKQYPECENCDKFENIRLFLFDQNLLFTHAKDRLTNNLKQKGVDLIKLKQMYFNERLHYVVRHLDAEHRIIVGKDKLSQNFDNTYMEPHLVNIYDWRAPMYVSNKNFLGNKVSTYSFNLIAIWFLCLIFYFILKFRILFYIAVVFKWTYKKIVRE